MIDHIARRPKISQQTLAKLKGKLCWYVSCGRNVGSSFQLALGKMIRRKAVLKNKMHPKSFRENDPEYSLLVWCDWRLSKRGEVIVTSDDCDNHYKWCRYLRNIAGSRITQIRFASSFLDLKINFNRCWQLDIFCDHGNRQPSIDANWEVFTPSGFVFGA